MEKRRLCEAISLSIKNDVPEQTAESQWEAVLTERDQVPIVLQHHVPLCRIQLLPLLGGKVHGHILECHGRLRHKTYFCSPSFTWQHPFPPCSSGGPGAERLSTSKVTVINESVLIVFRVWIFYVKPLVSVMCHARSARFNMRVSPLRDITFLGNKELKIKHELMSWWCSLAK